MKREKSFVIRASNGKYELNWQGKWVGGKGDIRVWFDRSRECNSSRRCGRRGRQ